MIQFFRRIRARRLLKELPHEFFVVLADSMTNIFGSRIFDLDDDGFLVLDNLVSTVGWGRALEEAVNKTGSVRFWSAYRKLDWFRGDLFDGEIAERMIETLGI